ncbi:MAG: hypothetical protein IKC64_05260 [Clostridia bacterium]|nr:hypothetical protein [Clostridia bacterium]
MDSVINSIRSLFSTYGFRATAVIVATIIIVNLIKKPIVAKAKAYQNETGLDKAVITKSITVLPVVVAFILEFLIELIVVNFNFLAVDFALVGANAVLYGALAVATYEGVKKQLEAYSAKRNEELSQSRIAVETTVNSGDTTPTLSQTKFVAEYTNPTHAPENPIVFNTND